MSRIECQMKDYIQPFERRLAMMELRALTGSDVIPTDSDEHSSFNFSIDGGANTERLRRNLAYWVSVGIGFLGLTAQLRAEATFGIARNGVALDALTETVPRLVPESLPNKRCLRYASHGLHEYRGKFFPQLVRALMNVGQVPEHGIVFDPMCGSGTTLVEASMTGRVCYGLDMNPLSVFVTRVKCDVLSFEPEKLIDAYRSLVKRLAKPAKKFSSPSYFRSLPMVDQAYLKRWFSTTTLIELDQITLSIQSLKSSSMRDFFLVCLSNILRRMSWQKDADLRVRKELSTLSSGEVTSEFVNEALRSTKNVAAFLVGRDKRTIGNHTVLERDARASSKVWPDLAGKVDAVITSPPYATALPYLDTDRLSLIYLGLLSRKDHRTRDIMMIGNREVTERTRLRHWEAYEQNKQLLPDPTRLMIEKIEKLNRNGEAGFRRRNLAALLAKYFFDMRSVIGQQLTMLQPRGMMFMVVGNNRTVAGGRLIAIETAKHLSEIAAMLGGRVAQDLHMDMLVSRDIFKKNAVPSESIITIHR